MTSLLDGAPYAERDDASLLRELVALTEWHRAGSKAYAAIVAGFVEAASFGDLPYLHASVFKHLALKTAHPDVKHGRILSSSATTGSNPSTIALDDLSSSLQVRSAAAILAEFVGRDRRPLIVVDDPKSMRGRGGVSARTAAALGLHPFASDVHFVLDESSGEPVVRWDKVEAVLASSSDVLVYGVSWLLWRAWGNAVAPPQVAERLAQTRVTLVHSGGFKRLASARVERDAFDGALLAGTGALSRVVDFYGLVEQNGVVFPLCERGRRHVPRWAHVIARDRRTLEPTLDVGLLQLLNPLPRGAPYHSVLTEDVGRLHGDPCPCGRGGPTFELMGRLETAEVRGCSDVGAHAPRGDARPDVPVDAESTRGEARFIASFGLTRIVLARPLDAVLDGFDTLRRRMARRMPPAFTRDDWAYLIRFTDPGELQRVLSQTFDRSAGPRLFFRPRSPVAVWLPSTTTLLGPLVLVLSSLGGARAFVKPSSRGTDLTTPFVAFARTELAGTALGDYFEKRVTIGHADRTADNGRGQAELARLRIVFGTDAAARAIASLPHPRGSHGLAFTERSSEAWIDVAAAHDPVVHDALVGVFGVHGQAACTAPRRGNRARARPCRRG